jgi:SAM-dependent methyltransferase
MTRARTARYGIDSPAIVAGQLGLGIVAATLATVRPQLFGLHVRAAEIALAAYLMYGGLSMIAYSRAGKLRLRDCLIDAIPWRGDERVLDVGCGRGLLLVGAARRLVTGTAVGVDLWLAHATTGNRPEAALLNAELEGVSDRVSLERADVRDLPFPAETFDVVLSNFVLHEVNTAADREAMLREMARVLKPGGHLALVDFIFTRECAGVLRRIGLANARRSRLGGATHWIGAVLTAGTFQLCAVTATKSDPSGI